MNSEEQADTIEQMELLGEDYLTPPPQHLRVEPTMPKMQRGRQTGSGERGRLRLRGRKRGRGRTRAGHAGGHGQR